MQKGDRLPASDRIESRLKSIARRMAPRASRLAAAGGIAAAAALGACVAAQQSNPNSFSADRAVQVFAAGYESIATRFVDNVAIGSVALDGMEGIAELDRDLRVVREGDNVELKRAGSLVDGFPAPRNDDADAWADLTVKILSASRDASPQIMNASAEDMYRAVFEKALGDLDEFSRYAGTDLASTHRALRDGFGGIGFEFTLTPDGNLKVTGIVPNTPADRQGLQVGDLITKIDGKPVAGFDRDEISRRLRGRVNTRVMLTMQRSGTGGTVTIDFDRGLIVPPTVTAKLEDGIAYIAIASFNQRTAESVASSFAQLKGQGTIKGIVLDLRNNPGGLLDQAIAVADLFLDGGEIIATHGRHPDSNQRFEASGNDVAKGVPIVALINGDSASAAEIVAAALQDQDRAVLVGSNSFGKGTVQNVIHLPNDGELTLTWSRIEAPSGYAFHRLGIMPTLCTSNSSVNVPELVANLRHGSGDASRLLAAWRSSHYGDEKTNEMRASCPPRHDLAAVDLEVARDVLQDTDLYARALKISGPAVASAPAAASPTASVANR